MLEWLASVFAPFDHRFVARGLVMAMLLEFLAA